MLNTEAERKAAADRALGNLRLEGLEPDEFGKHLLEQYIKGKITTEQAIQALNHRNSTKKQHVKVA